MPVILPWHDVAIRLLLTVIAGALVGINRNKGGLLMRLAWIPMIGLLLALVSAAGADEPPAATKKTFEKLIKAVEANDRAAFIADATEAVKKGMTDEVMTSVSDLLAPRLKKGYEARYLCDLKQAGHQVYLWKFSFKDGGDDVVVRIAMQDGKVDGFFLQ